MLLQLAMMELLLVFIAFFTCVKLLAQKPTGPFSMEKIKQPQAPFITFSWGDSGSFETLAEGEIYYSFVLVNDDGTEEENLPVVFVVSYDM